MSETMIHKVAMAIAEADLSDGPDDSTYDFFALPEEIVDGYYRIARAAIEAMREPTVAMIDMGCAAWIDLYPGFEGEKPHPTAGDVAVAIHRGMISAALKEQTK